jgi:hypothetical protein
MTKQKPKEWLKRYLPAEIAGTFSALVVAFIAKYLGYNAIIIAFAGSLGEAIGFYVTVFIKARKEQIVSNIKQSGFQKYAFIIATLLLEFGPAGLLDDFIIRPFFMYWLPILLKNFTIGIIAGKIAGDICFYFLVIWSYEFIKKKQNIKNNAAN